MGIQLLLGSWRRSRRRIIWWNSPAFGIAIAQEILARIFAQIKKVIGDIAEFARSAFAKRNNLHLIAIPNFQIFHEGAEVPVAGNDDDGVESGRELDRVNRQPHVPIRFLRSSAENLQIFGNNFNPDFSQRFQEVAFLARFCGDDISHRADESATRDRVLQNCAEVDASAIKILSTVIKVLGINEDPDPLPFMFSD